jgi:hypothetical protein
VRASRGVRSEDSHAGCLHEAEATVEALIAKQCDQRFTRRVGGADDGVHQRLTDAATLMVWHNADRAKPKRSELADPPAGADHVAGDPLITGRHQRERFDPSHIASQRLDQGQLARGLIAAGPAERS